MAAEGGLLSQLRKFDAYPKFLEDVRIKTLGGGLSCARAGGEGERASSSLRAPSPRAIGGDGGAGRPTRFVSRAISRRSSAAACCLLVVMGDAATELIEHCGDRRQLLWSPARLRLSAMMDSRAGT